MFIPEPWSALQKRHPEATQLITQKLKDATPTLCGYEASWSEIPIGLIEANLLSISVSHNLDHRIERLQHWLPYFENIQLIAYDQQRKVKTQVDIGDYFKRISIPEEIPVNLMGPDLPQLQSDRQAFPHTSWIWCDWDLSQLGWVEVQWLYHKSIDLKTGQKGEILYGLRGYQSFLLVKDPDTQTWHHGIDLHLTQYALDDQQIGEVHKKLRKIYPMELLKLNLLNPYVLTMHSDQDFEPLTDLERKPQVLEHVYIPTARAPKWLPQHKQHSLLSGDYSLEDWIAADKSTKFLGNGIRLTLQERTQVGLNECPLHEFVAPHRKHHLKTPS